MKKVMFIVFMIISVVTCGCSWHSKASRTIEFATEAAKVFSESTIVENIITENILTENIETYENSTNYWE